MRQGSLSRRALSTCSAQSEFNHLIDKQGVSKLAQGVTTEITCEGDSIALTNERLAAENADVLEHYKITQDWRSLGGVPSAAG